MNDALLRKMTGGFQPDGWLAAADFYEERGEEGLALLWRRRGEWGALLARVFAWHSGQAGAGAKAWPAPAGATLHSHTTRCSLVYTVQPAIGHERPRKWLVSSDRAVAAKPAYTRKKTFWTCEVMLVHHELRWLRLEVADRAFGLTEEPRPFRWNRYEGTHRWTGQYPGKDARRVFVEFAPYTARVIAHGECG